jgi:hypothetical protein
MATARFFQKMSCREALSVSDRKEENA